MSSRALMTGSGPTGTFFSPWSLSIRGPFVWQAASSAQTGTLCSWWSLSKDASLALRSDRRFALRAAACRANSVQYVAESLLQDRDFFLQAVNCNPRSLGFTPAVFRNQREFVLAAARVNGESLRSAPKFLRVDPELVNAAKASGTSLSSPPQVPSEESLEEKGIPLEIVGSLQAARDLAEQWDRLEQLSERGMLEDCALTGLPPGACLEAYGRDGLVDHLKAVMLWQALPLKALKDECAELGLFHSSQLHPGAVVEVTKDLFSISNTKLKQGTRGLAHKVDQSGDVCLVIFEARPDEMIMETSEGDSKQWVYKKDLDKLRVEKDDILAQELIESLIEDLFSDVCQQKQKHEHKSLPVKQLGSVFTASVVLRRWEQLRRMTATELAEEFTGLLGIRPERGTQRAELEAWLMDAAAWAEMSLAGLQDACANLAITPMTNEHAPEEERRRKLLERLHQSLCSNIYLQRGVDLRSVSSIEAGSKLLCEFDRIEGLGSAALDGECRRLGVPVHASDGIPDLKSRLRKVAGWHAMSSETLSNLCRQLGVRTAGNQPVGDVAGSRERLVKQLIFSSFAKTPPQEESKQRRQPGKEQHSSQQQRQQPREPFQPRRRTIPDAVRTNLRVLQLSDDASLDDVKRAYKRLALRHHPDKNSQEAKESSAKRFQEVASAYEALVEHFGHVIA